MDLYCLPLHKEGNTIIFASLLNQRIYYVLKVDSSACTIDLFCIFFPHDIPAPEYFPFPELRTL
jgi:hypothetical protein